MKESVAMVIEFVQHIETKPSDAYVRRSNNRGRRRYWRLGAFKDACPVWSKYAQAKYGI